MSPEETPSHLALPTVVPMFTAIAAARTIFIVNMLWAMAAGSDKLPMGKAGRQSGQVDKKRKGFDPYSSFEAHEIKGGKSSRAMHKAGNRSMTFR